jgi:hypothetical protein
VYLFVFHAYINEMRGSRSKIPSKKLFHIYIYIYNVKFLALLGTPYILVYYISRLQVKYCGLWSFGEKIKHKGTLWKVSLMKFYNEIFAVVGCRLVVSYRRFGKTIRSQD